MCRLAFLAATAFAFSTARAGGAGGGAAHQDILTPEGLLSVIHQMDWLSLCICLLLIFLLTLSFEFGMHQASHSLAGNKQLIMCLSRVSSELSVLGFVSLFLFVFETFGFLDKMFEAMHLAFNKQVNMGG
jgi:hypothetical protein